MSKKPLTIEKLDRAAEIIAKAKEAFEAAEQQAAEIRKDAVKDLKEKRKNILADLAFIDEQIAEITGKPAEGTTSGKSRIDGEVLKKTILEVVAENKDGISAKDIMAHTKLVELYKTVGKEVPQLAINLGKMVDAKEISKKGERKAAKYFAK